MTGTDDGDLPAECDADALDEAHVLVLLRTQTMRRLAPYTSHQHTPIGRPGARTVRTGGRLRLRTLGVRVRRIAGLPYS